MKISSILIINTIINFLVGISLILIPTTVFNFLSLSQGIHLFFIRALGALFIGLALALVVDLIRYLTGVSGLGLGGVILINLTISVFLLFWLCSESLTFNSLVKTLLWIFVVIILVLSGLEIVSLFRSKNGIKSKRARDKMQQNETEARQQGLSFIKGAISQLQEGNNGIVILILIAMAFGYLIGELLFVQALLIWISLSMTIIFSTRLLSEIKNGDSISLETSWGGLGGSLGGWKFSPSLVLLLATLVFGVITILSVSNFTNETNSNLPTSTPSYVPTEITTEVP